MHEKPTIVSGVNKGFGPPFVFPIGIAVEAAGALVVVDGLQQAIVRVNPETGDRAIVSK